MSDKILTRKRDMEMLRNKLNELYPPEKADNIKDPTQKHHYDSFSRCMDSILLEDMERNPTILEKDFITHLLPIFKNYGPDSDLRIWLQIAGSYDRPIDVVDNDRELLFTIPPVYGGVETTIASSGMSSLSELLSNIQSYNRTIPQYAAQLLNTKVRPMIKPKTISPEVIQAWNLICERYDIETTGEKDNESGETTKPANNAIYDDEEDL